MSRELLERIEEEPEGEATAAVIWMHGLGADGSDFAGFGEQLGVRPEHGVRFVFPHAPFQPVTINGGMRMRAWYDIRELGSLENEDGDGVERSREDVEALIAHERGRGIAPDRIVVAGFSQGGAIALHTGTRQIEPLAGILALSTYLPVGGRFEREATPASRSTPIFMAHGSYDPVLPLSAAALSRETLSAAGYTVEWHEYPMMHQVHPDEIEAIGVWLRRVLSL